MIKDVKTSWRTSLFGAGGLVTVLGFALNAQFDGDPETVPDWSLVVLAAFVTIQAFYSRDNGVSSEDVSRANRSGPGPSGGLAVFALLFAMSLAFIGCESSGFTPRGEITLISEDGSAKGGISFGDGGTSAFGRFETDDGATVSAVIPLTTDEVDQLSRGESVTIEPHAVVPASGK